MPKISQYLIQYRTRLYATFGRSMVMALLAIIVVTTLLVSSLIFFFGDAPPTSISIASGPKGSSYHRNALRYQELLAKHGVKVHVVETEGSIDNLHRLMQPNSKVDIGFVQSDVPPDTDVSKLVSLGSISNQPLFVFYRGKPKIFLADFAGQRMFVGSQGSGSRFLSESLLKMVGVKGAQTPVLEALKTPEEAADALLKGEIDALFMMSESTPSGLIKKLYSAPDIHLFSFSQADAYIRNTKYLSKIKVPAGVFDLKLNVPPQDTVLLAPSVELIAHPTLHPAISDLLLDAAKTIHGRAGRLRNAGEFPALQEHAFQISPDATRYFHSGKGYLYATFPFWLASWMNRLFAVILPVLLLLIPALKLMPSIYRWRFEFRINRWYGLLQPLEQGIFQQPLNLEKRVELLEKLDHIERGINGIKVPTAFANRLYGLREHVQFVRQYLLERKLTDV
jgi:TRAP-type uncharacterized transport system substrate-binding protein